VTIDLSRYRVQPHSTIRLAHHDTAPPETGADRRAIETQLQQDLNAMVEWQPKLRADENAGLLVVLLAPDTGGEDPTIRDVFGVLDLRGASVAKFGAPSEIDQKRDFLRRVHAAVPALGEIGIFNRSHYDDIVEPWLAGELDEQTRSRRYGHVRNFEQLLIDSGLTVLKSFFHISRQEQARRVLTRIDDPTEQHEFSPDDVEVNQRWEEYQSTYENVIANTSTDTAPWHVIPAEHAWYRNAVVARLVVEALEAMQPKYPAPVEDIEQYRAPLEAVAEGNAAT